MEVRASEFQESLELFSDYSSHSNTRYALIAHIATRKADSVDIVDIVLIEIWADFAPPAQTATV